MAKGVWNGGNASEAIESAIGTKSNETDAYVGGSMLWMAIPATMALLGDAFVQGVADEGGLDTINDGVEVLVATGVGALVGYAVRQMVIAAHYEGQTQGIRNIGSGVKDRN